MDVMRRNVIFKPVHSAHRFQVLSDWSGSIGSVNNEDQTLPSSAKDMVTWKPNLVKQLGDTST